MAIPPKYLEQKFQDELKAFEKKFDKFLSTQTITRGTVLNLDRPMGYTQDHHNVLKQRYLDAGWTDFYWTSDQRDGDYLRIKY